MNLSWEGWKQAPGLFPVSRPKLNSADLPLQRIDKSPTSSWASWPDPWLWVEVLKPVSRTLSGSPRVWTKGPACTSLQPAKLLAGYKHWSKDSGSPRAHMGVSPVLGPRAPGLLANWQTGYEEAKAMYRALSRYPRIHMRVYSAWFLCQQACS